MSTKKTTESRDRPFPWLCVDCFTETVVPTVIDHTAKVKHDGVIHELHLSNVEVPRCKTCGEIYPTDAVDDLVSDALRARLGLFSPRQIQKEIKRIGLKQQELAQRLGVTPESISRWATGALIQSRAMDNLLRLYFALPEARAMLRGETADPDSGSRDQNRHPLAAAASDAARQEPERLLSKAMLQQMIDEQIGPLRDQVRRLENEIHAVGGGS